MGQSESNETRSGKDDRRPVGSPVELRNPRIYVPSYVRHGQIRPQVQDLRSPAQTARGDHAPFRQLAPAERAMAHEGVSRILPWADGRDGDSRRQLSGEVLQRVHGKVDPALQQGVVNLLGEERATAEASQRYIGLQVTGSLDFDGFGFLTELPE
jgi:hypothetical protein